MKNVPKEEQKHIPYTGKVWEPPKQEITPEEAAEIFYPYDGVNEDYEIDSKRWSFIKGAEWQSKGMYSEEEVREAFRQGQDNMDYSEMYGWSSKLTEQEWLEQFSKLKNG